MRHTVGVKIYLAGPLFNDGERATLSAIAARLRADGYEVFVPHEQFVEMEGLDEAKVFRTDLDGVRSANLMLCWIDGTQVDDGTAVDFVERELPGAGDHAGEDVFPLALCGRRQGRPCA